MFYPDRDENMYEKVKENINAEAPGSGAKCRIGEKRTERYVILNRMQQLPLTNARKIYVILYIFHDRYVSGSQPLPCQSSVVRSLSSVDSYVSSTHTYKLCILLH